MEELLKMTQPKWEEAKKRKAVYNVPGKAYGVGLALGIYGSGLDGPDASEAAAELLPNGDVRVYNAWQDHGQGSDLGTAYLRPRGIASDGHQTVADPTGHERYAQPEFWSFGRQPFQRLQRQCDRTWHARCWSTQ